MTEQGPAQDRPDVEAVMEEIRRTAQEAKDAFDRETAPPPGSPTAEEVEAGIRIESDLYANLHAAHRTCRVGAVPPEGGAKGHVRRRAYALIGPLIAELNEHHVHVVRVLSKLTRILDGHDTEVSSEILMKTQRRVDLLTELCNRLERLEDLDLDARMKRLEEERARRQDGP